MSEPSYRVPTRIETERLVVRRYEVADAEQLAEIVPRNIAHLERFMEWTSFEPQTVEQRRAWISETNEKFDSGEDYTLGMFDLDGTLVGGTGFHVRNDPPRLEIGFWIDADFEGQGLVTEATAALTMVALTTAGAELVDITHSPANTRSAAIPARLGYERQDAPGHECFDRGAVTGVMWWATAATLEREPFASTPRPKLYGADGAPIPWPA